MNHYIEGRIHEYVSSSEQRNGGNGGQVDLLVVVHGIEEVHTHSVFHAVCAKLHELLVFWTE